MRALAILLLIEGLALADATSPQTSVAPGGPWTGIAASRRRPGVLALWSARGVALSDDGGRTFCPTFTPPGGQVRDVALDDEGRLYVLAGHHLLVIGPDGRARRQHLGRHRYLAALYPGPGLMAMVVYFSNPRADAGADSAMLVTRDGGRRWNVMLPEIGNARNAVQIDDDGGMLRFWATELSCGGGWDLGYYDDPQDASSPARSDDDGPGKRSSPDWDTLRLGTGGWTYDIAMCGPAEDYEFHLCAKSGGEPRPALAGVVESGTRLVLANNGRTTLALFGDRLLRLNGGTAADLGPAPCDVTALAVDANGTALFLVAGRMVQHRS